MCLLLGACNLPKNLALNSKNTIWTEVGKGSHCISACRPACYCPVGVLIIISVTGRKVYFPAIVKFFSISYAHFRAVHVIFTRHTCAHDMYLLQ